MLPINKINNFIVQLLSSLIQMWVISKFRTVDKMRHFILCKNFYFITNKFFPTDMINLRS